MLQSVQFDELAAYLRDRSNRDGFSHQRFQIGPLDVTLSIAPECAVLEMGMALTFAEPPRVLSENKFDFQPSAGLTVYVIQLRTARIARPLSPFFSFKSQSLQQLSGSSHAKQFVVRYEEHKLIKVFDQVNQIGLIAFEEPTLIPPWELFSPIKEFIHMYALDKSCLLLHAASLVSPGLSSQGTLIVGPGGSGKSTLTAYSIEQGMLTNGDDYVLVDLRQETPQCWSVYRTLKLHPSSPVLQGKNLWKAWRSDSSTDKSVMLMNTVRQGGPLLQQAALSRVCGLSLMQSRAVHNPKAHSILSDPYRHPYLHSCMSTIQQIPYRIDATLALSKKLHQSIPYFGYTIAPGIEGLQNALAAIQGKECGVIERE